jgi:hypothetical protein
MKLVTVLPDRRVLGVHMIGTGCPSVHCMLQSDPCLETASIHLFCVVQQAWAATRRCRASLWR